MTSEGRGMEGLDCGDCGVTFLFLRLLGSSQPSFGEEVTGSAMQRTLSLTNGARRAFIFSIGTNGEIERHQKRTIYSPPISLPSFVCHQHILYWSEPDFNTL